MALRPWQLQGRLEKQKYLDINLNLNFLKLKNIKINIGSFHAMDMHNLSNIQLTICIATVYTKI